MDGAEETVKKKRTRTDKTPLNPYKKVYGVERCQSLGEGPAHLKLSINDQRS